MNDKYIIPLPRPSAEETFDIPYIALSIPLYAGISIDELKEKSDVECQSLWKNIKSYVVDPLGFTILRYQAHKTLYPNHSMDNIVVTNSINELLYLLQRVAASNETPNQIGEQIDKKAIEFAIVDCMTHHVLHPEVSVLQYINSIGPDKYCVILNGDVYDKILSPIIKPNVIFVTSIEGRYGICGVPMSIAAISDDRIIRIISSLYNATCYVSSVISLMALRQSQEIIENNSMILSRNLDNMAAFFSLYRNKVLWKAPTYGFVGVMEFLNKNAYEYAKKARTCGILLFPFSERHVYLYIGQHNISSTMIALKQFIEYEHAIDEIPISLNTIHH
jgi:hypothetical protein